jgi:hypothetical protein
MMYGRLSSRPSSRLNSSGALIPVICALLAANVLPSRSLL